MELKLERRQQANETPEVVMPGGGVALVTPPIAEDYWAYRVQLGHGQAVVGFPKFSTIGIGFAIEDDWNTNLPYRCTTEKIFRHIKHNKGFEDIRDADVRAAIRLVQEAAVADRPGQGAIGDLG